MSANATVPAEYGRAEATGGQSQPWAGTVTALSITMNAARTAGTCEARVLINGAAHSEVAQINAVNTVSAAVVFATPPAFSAGAVIQLETVTVGFAPGTADASITAWIAPS